MISWVSVRHPGAGAGVDLDEPELVDIVVGEIVDRWVLGEEPVPVHAAARNRDCPEELRDRRRGQQALDPEFFAREELEVAAQHLDRADEEARCARLACELPELVEVEVRLRVARNCSSPQGGSW